MSIFVQLTLNGCHLHAIEARIIDLSVSIIVLAAYFQLICSRFATYLTQLIGCHRSYFENVVDLQCDTHLHQWQTTDTFLYFQVTKSLQEKWNVKFHNLFHLLTRSCLKSKKWELWVDKTPSRVIKTEPFKRAWINARDSTSRSSRC